MKFILKTIFLLLPVFMHAQDKPFRLPVNYIDGYSDKFSYMPGDTCTLYLNATSNQKTSLRLLTLDGIPVDTLEIEVTNQDMQNNEPWKNGFGYKPTCRYKIPRVKSGLYMWENTKVYFVIMEATKKSDIVIVYPFNTEIAYCTGGGKSLYDASSIDNKRASHVSFLRPIKYNSNHSLFSWGFLQWIITTNYNFRLISDIEMENYDQLKGSKLLVIMGHSEYWTRTARMNFDKFVSKGNDALILSGNTMWWQIRYDLPNKHIICYKDSLSDPQKDLLLKTVNFNKPWVNYSIMKSIGVDWEMGGFGLKEDKGWDGFKICVPTSPLLQGTNLEKGDVLICPTKEFDCTALDGFDKDGYPVMDKTKIGFNYAELIGFDKGQHYDKEMIMTFVALQKTKKTGRIINVGSTNWCSINTFYGPDNERIKKITTNMIDLMLGKKSIFSEGIKK
jgi:hypothetical protein